MATKPVQSTSALEQTRNKEPAVATVSNTNNDVVILSDRGTTTIQPHVVAKIAGLAVREVDGVHSLVPWNAGQTVHVPPGGMVHLRVFVDGAGRLVGSGVIPGDATAPEPDGPAAWSMKLLVGAEGAWSESRNAVGAFDQRVANGTAFIDAGAKYSEGRHAIGLTANVEQGMLLIQPSTGPALPPLKSRDRLGAGASYDFALNDGVAVFVQLGAETRLLPTDAVAAGDATIAFRLLDGSVRRERVTAPTTYRIADAWSPTAFKSGVGVKARLSTWKPVDLTLHAGGGYRNYVMGGAFVPDDNPQTDDIEYTEIAPFDDFGLLGGVDATIRLSSFASYTTGFELFSPIRHPTDLIVDWDNDVSFRLTRALSVTYRASLGRLPQATSRTAFSQGVFLRASWNLL